MLESAVEKKVCTWAKKNGWVVRKLAWVNRTAGPDRLFAKLGHVIFIEFKRPGKRPSPAQDREINRLVGAGVDAVWFDNAEEAIEYLEFSS